MEKVLKMLHILVAFLTIVLLGSLAWQCIDIYVFAEMDITASAYSYTNVSARLKQFAIPFAIYVVLIVTCHIISLLISPVRSARKHPVQHSHKAACAKAAPADARVHYVRLCLLILAAGLVFWGAANGSLYDVLVKSINICTECIGFG